MADETIRCKFLKKDISIGLCEEIFHVSARLLKREAVPEVDKYTRDELDHACDNCPYIN